MSDKISDKKKADAVFTRHSEEEIQQFETAEAAIQYLEQGLKDKELQPIAVISNYKVVWRYHNNRGKDYTDDYINEIRRQAQSAGLIDWIAETGWLIRRLQSCFKQKPADLGISSKPLI